MPNHRKNIKIVWNALNDYRENCIPPSDSDYDEMWERIVDAMSSIAVELWDKEED